MPMTVNSKLTHNKIRQISIENKRNKKKQKLYREMTKRCKQLVFMQYESTAVE